MNSQDTIKQFIDTFDQLKKKTKWQLLDHRVLMPIAATYVMRNHTFDQDRFFSIAKTIKQKAGFFSPLKSELRYTITSMLDLRFKEPQEQIPKLFHLYDEMIKAKFSRGSFTYISASILLTNTDEEINTSEVIHKAKMIYDKMRKQHPFLTSASDYPLATLLALEQDGAHERMDDFYKELNNNGFSKGNDLQTLSHILSIETNIDKNELVSRAIRVYDSFREVRIKQKAKYYSVMGMLALLPPGKINIQAVHNIYEQLNRQKQFKWQKDLNWMLAVSFYVSENMDESTVTEVNMITTMEAVLQAQQVIMISSTVAAVSVSNSSSNNN